MKECFGFAKMRKKEKISIQMFTLNTLLKNEKWCIYLRLTPSDNVVRCRWYIQMRLILKCAKFIVLLHVFSFSFFISSVNSIGIKSVMSFTLSARYECAWCMCVCWWCLLFFLLLSLHFRTISISLFSSLLWLCRLWFAHIKFNFRF